MNCQYCEKPAVIHITELTGPKPIETHLCEEHAQEYLKQADEHGFHPEPTSVAGALATQLKLGQTTEELARLDQSACPKCGITFLEFRQAGRLGCPHDYVFFEKELENLLMNIHGETRHTGKCPQRGSDSTDEQTELIRLRREMKEAVAREEYERASALRDEIRGIEERSR